jgi:hypothetical protein
MGDAWLNERLVEAPSALQASLAEWIGVASGAGDLADAGARALGRAGGRSERSAAYDLLAADALITYAGERAADAPDPEATLRSVLQTLLEVHP